MTNSGRVAKFRRTVIPRLSLGDNGMTNRTFPLHKIGISCDQENRYVAVTVADHAPKRAPAVRPSPVSPF